MKTGGYIMVTFIFEKQNRRWAGHCEELGTATFGRTLEDAKQKLDEAVLCHLNTLEDLGEREYFFKKHNIKFYELKPKPKEGVIEVPATSASNVYIQARLQRLPAVCPA
jgi:predicted RNase H-like HicB family nuclease